MTEEVKISDQLKAILSDPIRAEITACKVKFLMENPFIGHLATRLESVEAPWCRTGATDGRNLYWNREFMKGLNRDQKLFFIAHEIYHIIFSHVGRRRHRDPAIWNMACLAWGTPILMADGSVQPIQRVLPGDYIETPFGPNKVLGTMYSGVKKTLEFFAFDGAVRKYVRATPDHKFFSGSDFLEADFITNNFKNVYVTKLFVNGPSKDSLERAKRRTEIEQSFQKIIDNAQRGSTAQIPYLLARDGYDDYRLALSKDYADIEYTQNEVRSFREITSEKYQFFLKGDDYKTANFSEVINSLRSEPVFDLVTEYGCFFANGILTHNCDYNINYSLKREGIGSPPTDKNGKELILYDERYTDDMTADEIYDLLIENSTTIELPLDDHLELEGGDGDGDGDGDNESNGSSDQESDCDGNGNGDGKGKKKTTKLRVLGKDGPPKLTKEELEKLNQDIRSAVISAAQQSGAGSIPAGLKKMIDKLLEPKLDWRSMLDAYIRSSVKDDYSFENISRRSWGLIGGAILPGQKFIERVEVFCAIDASGSTTPLMMSSFLSEIISICETFHDFKIDVISFDTEVYNHQVFQPDNIDELYKYEIRGNGGTEFPSVYQFLKENSIEPERLVILTDGLPNSSWGDPNYCDTIFIIHSNTHIVPPFGLAAYIESDDRMFKKK